MSSAAEEEEKTRRPSQVQSLINFFSEMDEGEEVKEEEEEEKIVEEPVKKTYRSLQRRKAIKQRSRPVKEKPELRPKPRLTEQQMKVLQDNRKSYMGTNLTELKLFPQDDEETVSSSSSSLDLSRNEEEEEVTQKPPTVPVNNSKASRKKMGTSRSRDSNKRSPPTLWDSMRARKNSAANLFASSISIHEQSGSNGGGPWIQSMERWHKKLHGLSKTAFAMGLYRVTG